MTTAPPSPTTAIPAPSPGPSVSLRPASYSPLRAIIAKELRENLKFVVFILLAIALVALFIAYSQTNGFREKLHIDNALFHPDILLLSVIACPVAGLLLATLQIFNDRTFDIRAFLIHRAVTPSRIFFAKVFGGFVLYAIAIGLPLTAFTLWAALSPSAGLIFDIHFIRPYIVDFVTGLAYYFAGLLIAQRQARWYGSFLFPLAAALAASGCAMQAIEFTNALAAVLFLAALLAVAAWSTYLTGGVAPIAHSGRANDQPSVNFFHALLAGCRRVALPLVMIVSLTVIFGGMLVFVDDVIGSYMVQALGATRHWPPAEKTHYVALASGQPGLRTQENYLDPANPGYFKQTYTDLAGHVLAGAATQPDYYQNFVIRGYAWVSEYDEGTPYRDEQSVLTSVDNGIADNPGDPRPAERWYYIKPKRYYEGYNARTSAFLGTLGATGILPPGAAPQPFPWGPLLPWSFVKDAVVYRKEPITYQKENFLIGGYNPIAVLEPGEKLKWAQEDYTDRNVWVLLTDRRIGLVQVSRSTNSHPFLSVPFEQPTDQYSISVHYNRNSGELVIWYAPSRHNPSPMEYVYTYGSDGKLMQKIALPPLSQQSQELATFLKPVMRPYVFMMGMVDAFRNPLLAPLALHRHQDTIYDGYHEYYFPLNSLISSSEYDNLLLDMLRAGDPFALYHYAGIALPVLLAAAATLLLSRRYRYTRLATALWTLATLILGPIGLLTFLFTQPLSRRIPCPHCHKKRLVTRETCEHCAAPFPPPPRNGTEVFAP